jgi:hypothetical protein
MRSTRQFLKNIDQFTLNRCSAPEPFTVSEIGHLPLFALFRPA